MGLSSVLSYFAPLAAQVMVEGEVTLLHTPAVNVLGLNAAYLARPGQVPLARALLAKAEAPLLVASEFACTDQPGREVARLRVGFYAPEQASSGGPKSEGEGPESGVVVEQISRLHLPAWADVLAGCYHTPGWGPHLARHFGAVLEGQSASVLLLAYEAGEAVGALLWQASAEGKGGGAAHLWGASSEGAALALLNAAVDLGEGRTQTSVPEPWNIPLHHASPLRFTLLQNGPAEGQAEGAEEAAGLED